VLLVLGLSGVAQGSTGDPVLIGEINSATGHQDVTTLRGPLHVTRVVTAGSLNVNGVGEVGKLAVSGCAGFVVATSSEVGFAHISVVNSSCFGTAFTVATLNELFSPIRDLWVTSTSRCNCNRQAQVIIHFNRPLTSDDLTRGVRVTYLGFA
jgi:hypothetical protein